MKLTPEEKKDIIESLSELEKHIDKIMENMEK